MRLKHKKSSVERAALNMSCCWSSNTILQARTLQTESSRTKWAGKRSFRQGSYHMSTKLHSASRYSTRLLLRPVVTSLWARPKSFLRKRGTWSMSRSWFILNWLQAKNAQWLMNWLRIPAAREDRTKKAYSPRKWRTSNSNSNKFTPLIRRPAGPMFLRSCSTKPTSSNSSSLRRTFSEG